MFKQAHRLEIILPDWLGAFAQGYASTADLTKRMEFVIAAARMNVVEKSGGPFAAAIFESDSGNLVALGVNLVTGQGLSILHAEIVAIALAQRKLGGYDLGGRAMPSHDLFASTEPCAMCLGAIPWSGVRRLVTAACDEDARAIGFDEGDKPDDWVASLVGRGIETITSVGRRQAAEVLRFYADGLGVIYNAREG